MAKEQVATQTQANGSSGDVTAEIGQLEHQLKAMPNLPKELKEKLLNQARSGVSGTALTQITTDVQKLLGHERYSQARGLLKNQRLSLTIAVDGEGAITEVTHRLTKGARKGGKGVVKGDRLYVVNGEEFKTAAEAARKFGIDHKGDSAVRALKRARDAKQIESYEERMIEPATTETSKG